MPTIDDSPGAAHKTQREWLVASIKEAQEKREEAVRHGGRVGIGATYWKGIAEALGLTLKKLDRGDWEKNLL